MGCMVIEWMVVPIGMRLRGRKLPGRIACVRKIPRSREELVVAVPAGEGVEVGAAAV